MSRALQVSDGMRESQPNSEDRVNYYFTEANGTQQGPFPVDQLLAKGVKAETLVWAEGLPQWQRADSVPELRPLFQGVAPSPPPPMYPGAPTYPYGPTAPYPPQYVPPPDNSKKIAAGLCGILLGALGIHKFILGMNGAGVTMLLISVLTCGFGAAVMSVIGLIEGIIYLTKSDAEFYQTYVVQKKEWF
jgi:TM2 domain-containing membrane protein YozV